MVPIGKRAAGLRRRSRMPKAAKRRAGMTKAQERELDHLCAATCKAIAGHRCERCAKGENLQWHHVFTRRIRATRWLLLNSVCLCSGCHFWWHTVAQGGEQWEWFATKYGADRLKRLREAQRAGGRPDYNETRRELESHRREP